MWDKKIKHGYYYVRQINQNDRGLIWFVMWDKLSYPIKSELLERIYYVSTVLSRHKKKSFLYISEVVFTSSLKEQSKLKKLQKKRMRCTSYFPTKVGMHIKLNPERYVTAYNIGNISGWNITDIRIQK